MLDRYMFAVVVDFIHDGGSRFTFVQPDEESCQRYIESWTNNGAADRFGKARICRVRVTELLESEDIFPPNTDVPELTRD